MWCGRHPTRFDTRAFAFRCGCGNTPQGTQGTIARGLEISLMSADIIDAGRSRLT
jgi:hypothetical protein